MVCDYCTAVTVFKTGVKKSGKLKVIQHLSGQLEVEGHKECVPSRVAEGLGQRGGHVSHLVLCHHYLVDRVHIYIHLSACSYIVIGLVIGYHYAKVTYLADAVSAVSIGRSGKSSCTVLRHIAAVSTARDGDVNILAFSGLGINQHSVAFGSDGTTRDGSSHVTIGLAEVESGIAQIACTIAPITGIASTLTGKSTTFDFEFTSFHGNGSRATIDYTFNDCELSSCSMSDGIVHWRDECSSIDSNIGIRVRIISTGDCAKTSLNSTTINSNLALVICSYTILTFVDRVIRDNGIDITAIHHKLTITSYIYQWSIIDISLIWSFNINFTRTVLLGIHKSKFAIYVDILGIVVCICTLDRMTIHVKDYVLTCLYSEVTARSHINIIEHCHCLSSCCCICSSLQRGILCFAYLGVVSSDNIDTILLLSHSVFIQESRHIFIIGTALQFEGALGISHIVGINQSYGFLGTIHLGFAVNTYAGGSNSRIVGITVKDNAAHANSIIIVAHGSCSRGITLSVDFATGHRHLTTTHEHAHTVGHIDGSASDIECSLIGMIDTASSRRFVSSMGSKRTTTHIDSGAAITFSTIASDTSKTMSHKFTTKHINLSAWVADIDGSALGFNLATLDIGSRGSRFFGSATFDKNHYIGSSRIGGSIGERTALQIEYATPFNTNTIVNIRTVIRTAVTTIFDSQITMNVNGNTLEYQVFAIQVYRNFL